jgi:hypothetical protein
LKFKNPIKKFNLPINLENWFLKETIRSKRAKIKSIIFDFSKKQKLQQLDRKNEADDNGKDKANTKISENNEEKKNDAEKCPIDGDNHLKHEFDDSFLKKF